ncbi:MAG TPA: hypothetical protein VK590_05435 [Saprospiraceae bacterium]|nr:hypothetical protein [Saprospiraceae bacterium]
MKQVLPWCFLCSFLFNYSSLSSQNLCIPIGSKSESIIDRWLIQSYGASIPASIKAFNRKDAMGLALELDSLQTNKSSITQSDIQYIIDENSEFYPDDHKTGTQPTVIKPLLKYFYTSPANFYELKKPAFYLKINPILSLSYGKESGNTNNQFENSRGFELRGSIDNTVYIYTQLIETQASYPIYLTDRINRFKAVMGNGFYKAYASKVFHIDQGYDFNNANAYIGFNISSHIGLQFGYGKNFIGDGIRSLLLSDNSNNYLYLKLNTHIWKINYQNIFGELQADGANSFPGDELLIKKYFAAHYLNYKFHKNWSIGLFETVVFSRKDHFDFQYLNPVILYRTVEGAIGSPDNILAGINLDGNLFRTIKVYGQVMLDEFVFKELITNNRDWWANKYGLQAGIKYINAFGIQDLDLQAELNLVRPYTYSHSDSTSNYSHYNQPLAHPLGANFIELIGHITYRPTANLKFQAWIHHYDQGLNEPGLNWGEDILESNINRVKDYGNELLQGKRIKVNRMTLQAQWSFWHNMNLFGEYTYRRESSDVINTSSLVRAGVRVNFVERMLLY